MRAKDPGRKSAFNIGPANIRRSGAAASRHAFLKSERVVRVQSEADPVERPLRIECVIKLGTKYLEVPLRLREAAHNAMYTLQQATRFASQAGDDSAFGRCSGSALVGWGESAIVPSDDHGFQTGKN
jgi:hypothetical protein